MTYLILKMIVLLLLAGAIGFRLGGWWIRRRFIDVTEEHHRLTNQLAITDYTPAFSSLHARMQGLASTLPQEIATASQKAFHSTLTESLNAVSRQLSQLDRLDRRIERLATTGETDLHPMEKRLGSVDTSLTSLSRNIAAQLTRFEGRIARLEEAISAIPLIPRLEPTHLRPLMDRIETLEVAIRADIAEFESANLRTLAERLIALESSIRTPPETEDSSPVDLTLIHERLETVLGQLSASSSNSAPQPAPLDDGPLLLQTAKYGPPDDLKRIVRIGKILEGILNRLGIWYFWQIASWNESDIEYVDHHLEVFRGRIRRDDWVTQSRRLARESVNRPPGNDRTPD